MLTKGRTIAAMSMRDILEVVHIQQQSGLLSAECVRNGQREEGELYLLAGQPIYARVGWLIGYGALQYLVTWRNIYFSFVTRAPRPRANISLRAKVNDFAHVPRGVYARAGEPALSRDDGITIVQERLPGAVNRAGRLSEMALQVPRNLGPRRNVLALPLTRRQRVVYLLVDGRRTIADLARCTRRAEVEVESILGELQQRGLVAI